MRAFRRTSLLWCIGVALVGCAAREPGSTPAGGASGAALRITGQLIYLARIALPPDASAIVELREVTVAGGSVVAEQQIALAGKEVPIPFVLSVDRPRLVEGRRYQLRGAVFLRNRDGWVSEPIAVDVTGGDVAVGDLRMAPIAVRLFSVGFRCGETRVVVWPDGEQLRMSADGQEFRMAPQVSASGERYVAVEDPGTQFWSKGSVATLELRGTRYPECVQVGNDPPATPLPARRRTARSATTPARFRTASGSSRISMAPVSSTARGQR